MEEVAEVKTLSLQEVNACIQSTPALAGQVSDGYHTFDELYNHRVELYIQLCRAVRHSVWKSRRHSDGELAYNGKWFVLGIFREPGRQITYHVPIDRWHDINCKEEEKAPEFDGHTPNDVLWRLKHLL